MSDRALVHRLPVSARWRPATAHEMFVGQCTMIVPVIAMQLLGLIRHTREQFPGSHLTVVAGACVAIAFSTIVFWRQVGRSKLSA